MNFSFLFKAIAGCVVVGAIFLAGVVAGGSFATGMAEDGVLRQVEQCLPARSADELRPCLSVADTPEQP